MQLKKKYYYYNIDEAKKKKANIQQKLDYLICFSSFLEFISSNLFLKEIYIKPIDYFFLFFPFGNRESFNSGNLT
jgi:hypothetical protein